TRCARRCRSPARRRARRRPPSRSSKSLLARAKLESVGFESLRPPYLLLSAPDLLDPNFARSVVLIGHHTTEGAIGWIGNRVIDSKAIEILPEPLGKSIHPETPLRLGGPVLVNGLIVVHRREVPHLESVEIAPGIRVSASPEVLPELFGAAPRGVPAGLLVFG